MGKLWFPSVVKNELQSSSQLVRQAQNQQNDFFHTLKRIALNLALTHLRTCLYEIIRSAFISSSFSFIKFHFFSTLSELCPCSQLYSLRTVSKITLATWFHKEKSIFFLGCNVLFLRVYIILNIVDSLCFQAFWKTSCWFTALQFQWHGS